MPIKKILHLTLKRKWFDLIADRVKTIEFRDIKPYWVKRLEDKVFDEVHFRNGYSKDSPFMRVEFISIERVSPPRAWFSNYDSNGQYAIYLGEILEIRNWETQ